MRLIRLLLKLRGSLARSWWLSRCLYRLHRLPLIGPPDEEVWYFAYGANMHDSVFRGWRGMRPLDWRPGRVRGFRLRFNLDGRPKGKAAPANLFPDPRAEVWGVLYRLTRRELVRLDASEGIPWSSYRPLWLDAEDINGSRQSPPWHSLYHNCEPGCCNPCDNGDGPRPAVSSTT